MATWQLVALGPTEPATCRRQLTPHSGSSARLVCCRLCFTEAGLLACAAPTPAPAPTGLPSNSAGLKRPDPRLACCP